MAVIPKPASTVVLMDNYSRIYLTKRPKTMKFMAGFHVFPGGSVEEKDYAIKTDHIHSDVFTPSLSLAHYIAAARELFEEVGILLGDREDGLPLHLTKEKEKKYRSQLLSGEVAYMQILEQEGLHLNLQSLTYFGQIITPKQSPIRFDTRFFLTELPKGQEPDPDETEIDEAFWILPEDALKAFQNREIKLAPPTIFSLKTIMKYQNGAPLMMSVSEKELLNLLESI